MSSQVKSDNKFAQRSLHFKFGSVDRGSQATPSLSHREPVVNPQNVILNNEQALINPQNVILNKEQALINGSEGFGPEADIQHAGANCRGYE